MGRLLVKKKRLSFQEEKIRGREETSASFFMSFSQKKVFFFWENWPSPADDNSFFFHLCLRTLGRGKKPACCRSQRRVRKKGEERRSERGKSRDFLACPEEASPTSFSRGRRRKRRCWRWLLPPPPELEGGRKEKERGRGERRDKMK